MLAKPSIEEINLIRNNKIFYNTSIIFKESVVNFKKQSEPRR